MKKYHFFELNKFKKFLSKKKHLDIKNITFSLSIKLIWFNRTNENNVYKIIFEKIIFDKIQYNQLISNINDVNFIKMYDSFLKESLPIRFYSRMKLIIYKNGK